MIDELGLKGFAVGDALLEFDCFLSQFNVGKLLHPRLEVVDGGNDRTNALDFAFVLGAEDFG